MMGLSLGHIIILLIVVMLFGPKRVGQLGEQLGKSLRGLRDSLDDAKKTAGVDSFNDSLKHMKSEAQALKDSVNPLKTAEKKTEPSPAAVANADEGKKPQS